MSVGLTTTISYPSSTTRKRLKGHAKRSAGTDNRRVWPGAPYPLGATWDGKGVNFALYSENATKVELCLFEALDAVTESVRIPLPENTDLVWHCYLPDATPG